MEATRVLFLCPGNSARSQMGEAFMNLYGNPEIVAYSAGSSPRGLNPMAVEVMGDIDVDITGQESSDVDLIRALGPVDVVITLCEESQALLNHEMLAHAEHYHWPIENPSVVEGDYATRLDAFYAVRDTIMELVRQWVYDYRSAAQQIG